MSQLSEFTESILDYAASRAAGSLNYPMDKYSIVPCLENKYLNGEFDPFKDLEERLMMLTIIETHNLPLTSFKDLNL